MPDYTTSNRLSAIDLARGIAMLGVALVNIHAFAAVWGTPLGLDLAKSTTDVVAEYIVILLFTHRSYPVLAFLFGVGLAWQWRRASSAGGTPKALRPRLWALLIIGFAHGLLLWPGEILATYAIVGLVVTHAFLDCDERRALRWAISALVLSVTLSALIAWGAAVKPPEPWPVELTGSSFAASVWSDAQRLRLGEFFSAGLLQIVALNVWWTTLLGVWAGRTGFLNQFLIAPFANRVVCAVGIVCLIGSAWIALFFSTRAGWNVRNADW